MDIDIELPPNDFRMAQTTTNAAFEYDPLTYFFEREDASQVLVWVWNDGTVLLAERRNSSEIWSPPITGEKR